MRETNKRTYQLARTYQLPDITKFHDKWKIKDFF